MISFKFPQDSTRLPKELIENATNANTKRVAFYIMTPLK